MIPGTKAGPGTTNRTSVSGPDCQGTKDPGDSRAERKIDEPEKCSEGHTSRFKGEEKEWEEKEKKRYFANLRVWEENDGSNERGKKISGLTSMALYRVDNSHAPALSLVLPLSNQAHPLTSRELTRRPMPNAGDGVFLRRQAPAATIGSFGILSKRQNGLVRRLCRPLRVFPLGAGVLMGEDGPGERLQFVSDVCTANGKTDYKQQGPVSRTAKRRRVKGRIPR